MSQADREQETKPQSLRDQMKDVVYQVSPVFVTESGVVFRQQFGHFIPAIILIMDQIVSCHVTVYFHPADFFTHMYAV